MSIAAGARLLVSIATYKERDNLEPLVRAILEQLPDADVLVIDDNSPDGTGELAEQMAARDPRIHVLHRAGKLGLGTAIRDAMHYAMRDGYDFFLNMDADWSHHPRYLPAVVAGMKDHDVMIGSRYVPGGGTLNWPLKRHIISKSVNGMVRLLLRIPAQDCSGSYRCYRVALLRQLDLAGLLSLGYSFQQEVLYRCWRARARIGETPIIFEERRAGASKVNLHEMVRSLGMLLLLGTRNIFGDWF